MTEWFILLFSYLINHIVQNKVEDVGKRNFDESCRHPKDLFASVMLPSWVPDFVILSLGSISFFIYCFWNPSHINTLFLTWISCIWIRMLIISVTIYNPSPRYMLCSQHRETTLLDTHVFDTGLSGHVMVGSCLALYISTFLFCETISFWFSSFVLLAIVNASVLLSGGHWSNDVFLSDIIVVLLWNHFKLGTF